MRRALCLLIGTLPAALLACNAILGNDSWTPLGGTPVSGADAAKSDNTSPPSIDASSDHASTDAKPPPSDTTTPDHAPYPDANESGLDPCLVLPAADAAPCPAVGFENSCALGECLIVSSASAGRCQNCQAEQGLCSGHADAFCAVAEDCDIGWACYCHACTLMCPLSTPQFCGSSTCVNVGNATEGICYPPN